MPRFVLVVAVLAVALVLAVRSAAAAPAHAPASAPPVIEREENTFAQAWAAGFSLEYFSPDKSGGNAVCLTVAAIETAAGDESGTYGYELGCASVAAGQLSLGKDLEWAALAPVAIDLIRYVCDGGKEGGCTEEYSRTVTVAADWTANGDLLSERLHSEFPQNACTVTTTGSFQFRPTTAVIAIDGAEFAGEGAINTSETKRKTLCK